MCMCSMQVLLFWGMMSLLTQQWSVQPQPPCRPPQLEAPQLEGPLLLWVQLAQAADPTSWATFLMTQVPPVPPMRWAAQLALQTVWLALLRRPLQLGRMGQSQRQLPLLESIPQLAASPLPAAVAAARATAYLGLRRIPLGLAQQRALMQLHSLLQRLPLLHQMGWLCPLARFVRQAHLEVCLCQMDRWLLA